MTSDKRLMVGNTLASGLIITPMIYAVRHRPGLCINLELDTSRLPNYQPTFWLP